MKPNEFMDALSDVNEAYVRQMLNENDAEAPAGAPQKGGARMDQKITVTAGRTERPDEIRSAGTDNLSGGKLRYLVLAASAAACIAGVFGITQLHSGNQSSLASEPQFTEVQETQTEPAVTMFTEAEAVIAVTTKNAADKGFGTTAPVTALTVFGTAAAKTEAVTAGTQPAAQTKPAENAAETTKPRSTTAAGTSGTKTTTSAEPETTVTTTTTVHRPDADGPQGDDYYQPYTQSYLLGDVDADGEITLIDYFLAERECFRPAFQAWYRITVSPLDADAADRGNIDRILEREPTDEPNEYAYTQVSLMDATYIRDLVFLRTWLGYPDMTVSDLIDVQYYEDEHFAVRCGAENNHFELLYTVFEVRTDPDGIALIEDHAVGTMVPQAVRDFYNAAMVQTSVVPDGDDCFHTFLTWSDEEFSQKMNELRALLAAG